MLVKALKSLNIFGLQLIYDFKEGEGTFGLLAANPQDISPEKKKIFQSLGFDIPSALYVPSLHFARL